MISEAGRAAAEKAAGGEAQTTTEFLLGIIPTTLVSPLVGESVLQTLFVALLVGFAIQGLGNSGQAVLRGVKHFERVVFRVLSMIMWLAPIGAFGAIAAVVGETGWSALVALGQIMLGFYITCLLFVVVILGTLLRFVTGLSIFKLMKYLAPGVPADRLDLVVGDRAAAADREARAHGRFASGRRHHRAHRLLVQPRRHRDLPDDGVAVHRLRAGRPAVGERADLAAAVHDDRLEGRRRVSPVPGWRRWPAACPRTVRTWSRASA